MNLTEVDMEIHGSAFGVAAIDNYGNRQINIDYNLQKFHILVDFESYIKFAWYTIPTFICGIYGPLLHYE